MIYPLITKEGIVLNNMMPGEGALGGYTPKGTASSEGISLLLRGIVRAAIATNDPAKVAYARFLFNACCNYFFKSRPTANADDLWNHSWILNGGEAFSVRGPLQASGDLATSGYIFGHDAESSITFTAGRGLLNPAPDVVYQAVSSDSLFVWQNVFSDLVQGTELDVTFYIDAKGNKIFGTQKGGSFAQPSIRFADRTEQDKLDNPNGTIVLTTPQNGVCGINYCITVADINVAYSELYEAWPMWRKLAENEVSTAGDAIHWFADAFKLAKEMEPSNIEWQHALDRMLDVWITTCNQESNTTKIFKNTSLGDYNNFPLTYAFAYGRSSVDDVTSNWSATPPSDKLAVSRVPSGHVQFTLPAENGVQGSGLPIRYGVVFENKPLYLNYTDESSISVESSSSIDQTVVLTIESSAGQKYDTLILVGPTTTTQSIGINQFMAFQSEAGDATGDKTGDWSSVIDPTTDTIPVITAVPFPGNRIGMVGDSITQYNSSYFAPSGGHLEYYAQSSTGYFTHANALCGQRFVFEPSDYGASDVRGKHMGTNFAVASSTVEDWWNQDVNYGVPDKGPMWSALQRLADYDTVVLMGGTNDLSKNRGSLVTANLILKAAAELAVEGKWVFVGAIPPRSRGLLSGYTTTEADAIRARVLEVNALVKARINLNKLGGAEDLTKNTMHNVWFVDYYNDLLGPNGTDPMGSLSQGHVTNGSGIHSFTDLFDNFSPAHPGLRAMHDGLHPGALGAYLMGKKFAEAFIAAGVPARVIGGTNIAPNSSFLVQSFDINPATVSTNLNMAKRGWARGLGSEIVTNNVATGWTHGVVPRDVHFYRASNVAGDATYSNFMEYAWSSLSGTYSEVLPFTNDSTWQDGDIITAVSSGTFSINVNIPAGNDANNRNNGFVINMHVPDAQHGVWDNYGYNTSDNGPVRTNSVYDSGDKLTAICNVSWNLSSGKITSSRLIINLLGVNNNDANTMLAKISSIVNSHNFWPPNDLKFVNLPRVVDAMALKTPRITVPSYTAGETRRYAQVKLEFSFDSFNEAVTGTINISNLRVIKE